MHIFFYEFTLSVTKCDAPACLPGSGGRGIDCACRVEPSYETNPFYAHAEKTAVLLSCYMLLFFSCVLCRHCFGLFRNTQLLRVMIFLSLVPRGRGGKRGNTVESRRSNHACYEQRAIKISPSVLVLWPGTFDVLSTTQQTQYYPAT